MLFVVDVYKRQSQGGATSMNPVKALMLGTIRLYQLTLSPWVGRECRYLPTCSNYAIEAIKPVSYTHLQQDFVRGRAPAHGKQHPQQQVVLRSKLTCLWFES